jgi:hypothetical protein
MAGGSSGSSSSRRDDGGVVHITAAEKQEAVRSAKAIIATVRNDWDWETEMSKSKRRKTEADERDKSAAADRPTVLSAEDEESQSEEDDREYRSREESESEDASKIISNGRTGRTRLQDIYPDDEAKNTSRYNEPDALGTRTSGEDLKAKRRKDLEEEMKWNEGLRIWVERRDLWTQADKAGRVPIGKSKFEDVSMIPRDILCMFDADMSAV